jgi:pimeloyl-ACP methyl ester carboxylesterase
VARRRRGRWFSFLVAAAVVTGLALLPPVQARGKAAAMLAEAVGLGFPRPFAPPVSREEATLDGVTGDLYRPDRPAPAILLVLGAAPRGADDPRAVRLARAIARAGRVVFVPHLVLAEQRFDEGDLDRIARAVVGLDEHPATTGPVTMLGISYGGAFALVAAADPRVAGRLAQVAVFGAYWDLVGVIQAVTTGVSVVGGERIPWEDHPLAGAILEQHAVDLAPEASRAELRAALDGQGDADRLDPPSRAIFDLLSNRDPARTAELAARLAPSAREMLSRFSPSSVKGRLAVPVIAMHSTDDPAVPYGEALRLVRALPEARLVTVSSFRHVDFRTTGAGGWLAAASDLWEAWRFASWLLEAQE